MLYFVILAWNMFIMGGCAYLVFWKAASAWWFVLATILIFRIGK
jgi:hypothetical protein